MARNGREVSVIPRFRSSLIEIWDYIAQDSVQNADKFIYDLKSVMNRIEKYPEANPVFRPLAGKRKLYRVRIYKKNYLIIYKLLKYKLIYVRLVYSRRNPSFYKSIRTKDYK